MAAIRDTILDHATSRFLSQGFKRTSVEQIAADVGMVKSGLYNHFKNKEALFKAMIERLADEHKQFVRTTLDGQLTASGRLLGAMQAHLDFMVERAVSYKLSIDVWHELRPLMIATTIAYHDGLIGRIEGLIREGIDAGRFECEHPDVIAQMLQLTSDNLVEQVLLGQMTANKARRFLQRALYTLLHGMNKRS